MSKRVSNKSSARGRTTMGRQRVRLGWRKRLLRELRIRAAIERLTGAVGGAT